MHSRKLEIYRELKSALARGSPAVMATVIASRRAIEVGAKALWVADSGAFWQTAAFPSQWCEWTKERCVAKPGQGRQRVVIQSPGDDPGFRVAFEFFAPAPRLIIAGAGHIAQPTHWFAARLGFAVTVIDDRPDFANRERFPHAAQVICDDFGPGLAQAGVDDDCAVVVITRGHRHDLEVLAALFHVRPWYLGMIGSRRRVLTVLEQLKERGAPQDFLDRIYAPIGLDIGAETPEEIALAIVAEIICVMRGGTGGHLRWRPGKGESIDAPLAR